jgi:hypothetical protein
MVETKSRISDMRLVGNNGQLIPSLDQNGQGYCATADTEVLTEKGWVGWPDYNGTDLLGTVNQATGLLEFQAPLARQVFDYKGEMVYSTNRRVDFGVTPNHRMYVRKWDERLRTLSPSYSFVEAKDLGWYAGLMHAPAGHIGTEFVRVGVPGDREYAGDDFLALMGLLVSDGYAGGTEKTRNWVSFASFREETREEISALAHRLGFHPKPSEPSVWVRYDAGALAEWVRANCYTDDRLRAQRKKVPDFIKAASGRQIRHFLKYFDDRTRNGLQFYSTSKRLIDDLQELHLRVGKRSVVDTVDPKTTIFRGKEIRGGGAYQLTVGDVDRLCLDRKKHLTTDRYNGLVYCATVPNSTLVTRRNGTVLISGNCWYYSTTMAVMMARLVANLPYVRLSAHAGACMIKNFRDEGGWCGLSMERQMSHGTPSVEFWPEKSMSRSNDRPEVWANAAKHKVSEGWVDLASPVYDRNLTFDQAMTLLLCRVPLACDWNDWSHSTCMVDPVEVEPGSFGMRGINSWTDSWGDRGMFVRQGRQAIPDSAVGILVTGASPV